MLSGKGKFKWMPIKTANIQNTDHTKCWRGCGMGSLTHRWWGCKMVQPLWKTVWCFLTKLNILTTQSSDCDPWHVPKGAENLFPHRILRMDIYSSFIHCCQDLAATKTSFSGWRNERRGVQASGCQPFPSHGTHKPTAKILRHTPKIWFLLIWQKNIVWLWFIHMDSYCCVGCCDFFPWQSKGKEVSAPD